MGAGALLPVAAGVGLCVLLAVAALLLGAMTGLPAMVLALAAGLIVRLVAARPVAWASAGITFTGTHVLRAGVALLGFRVAWAELSALGAGVVGIVLASVALTLGGGYAIARLFALRPDMAAVSTTAVGICGASAALAASAAMPPRPGLERETMLLVLLVSLLSTLAMLVYPLVADGLGLPAAATAMFLGAAIHDVAQAAGAGFSISEAVGVKAVTVKMLRVAMLLPTIMCLAMLFQPRHARTVEARRRRWLAVRPPIFLLVFFAFAVLTSLALLPPALSSAAGQLAGLMLAAAIASIGLRTTVRDLRQAEPRLALVLFAQSLWQVAVVLVLVLLFVGRG